jgi:hypothetical protein
MELHHNIHLNSYFYADFCFIYYYVFEKSGIINGHDGSYYHTSHSGIDALTPHH